MHTTDQSILEVLNKTQNLMREIAKNPAKDSLIKYSKSLAIQNQELKKAISLYKEKHFSYEFYEACFNLAKSITELRVNKRLRVLLRETSLWTQFNLLIDQLLSAVHRHDSLLPYKPSAQPTSYATDPIEEARAWASETARHTTEALAAAEKANIEGEKNLEKIQEEIRKMTGILSQETIEQSVAHTMTIYAHNAAATLATDVSTTALVDLQDLLAKSK